MSKFRVVFARHGESDWTFRNLFCGWVDVDLTAKGREEAQLAGKALKAEGLKFDVAYTSLLKRAQDSLNIILKEIQQPNIKVVEAWQLNERHYGDLTGFNKAEMAAKFGEKQVQVWRRSFDVLPPPMTEDHKHYKEIVNNPAFKSIQDKIPKSESLKTTMERVVPYWKNVIVPDIKSGKRVLIVCHGTSLRGLVKHLSNISDADIMDINLPTGFPFIFEFSADLKPVVTMKYLANEEEVRKAALKVASVDYNCDVK